METNEIIEMVREWKFRNDKGRCAFCGSELPRAVIDATYVPTDRTRLVIKALKMLDNMPEDLRDYLMKHGIAVCVKHAL